MPAFQLQINGVPADVTAEGYAVILDKVADWIRTEGKHPPGITVHQGPISLAKHIEWKFKEK